MNDAQVAATENLRAAIAAHQEAFGNGTDDGFIADFAYVAQVARLEASDRSEYLVGYHTSPLPDHVAVGLFAIGHDIATSGWDPDD